MSHPSGMHMADTFVGSDVHTPVDADHLAGHVVPTLGTQYEHARGEYPEACRPDRRGPSGRPCRRLEVAVGFSGWRSGCRPGSGRMVLTMMRLGRFDGRRLGSGR